MSIVLSRFARQRLFGRDPKLHGLGAAEFEAALNARAPEQVLDGYAPFCKLHVYRNWTPTPCGYMEINADNAHRLRSGYEARVAGELPVLNRWFEGAQPPTAEWLIAILYTRAQLVAEGENIEADWGVVGCLATMEPVETPMAPITMMRNALGIAEGGSGVALDPDSYRAAVDFWSRHANWRPPAPE